MNYIKKKRKKLKEQQNEYKNMPNGGYYMYKCLMFSMRLKNKKNRLLCALGAVMILIPLLYCKWIEFSVRNVQIPQMK